ncbi:MAG: hypothetical protein ACFB2Y_00860 [Fulvivirga sp.]
MGSNVSIVMPIPEMKVSMEAINPKKNWIRDAQKRWTNAIQNTYNQVSQSHVFNKVVIRKQSHRAG